MFKNYIYSTVHVSYHISKIHELTSAGITITEDVYQLWLVVRDPLHIIVCGVLQDPVKGNIGMKAYYIAKCHVYCCIGVGN